MSFQTSFSLATTGDFRQRIKICIIKSAQSVMTEAASGNTDRDNRRRNLANSILRSPDSYVEAFSFLVAANPAITAASSDSDIEFTVNSGFNGMANVNANQLIPNTSATVSINL